MSVCVPDAGLLAVPLTWGQATTAAPLSFMLIFTVPLTWFRLLPSVSGVLHVSVATS
jgi:hypothetical protein